MKPYAKLDGKIKSRYYWGDPISKRIMKIFKKSKRQENKKEEKIEQYMDNVRPTFRT